MHCHMQDHWLVLTVNMEDMEALRDYSAIGPTNSGVIPVIGNRFIREHNDDKSDIINNLSDKEATIANFRRTFAGMEES